MAEYVSVEEEWNWNKLSLVLSVHCLELLIPSRAPSFLGEPNPVAWLHNINGGFSLKTAYECWGESDISARNRLKKAMWKLQAQQRLKMFM